MKARSRSKLKHILDKLKGAIRNILDMTKTQQPEIDYASLISLSNSSRVDAIKTMDDLSRRLNKPSSISLPVKKTSGSSSTSSSSSRSKRKVVQEDKDAHKPKSKSSKNKKTKESSHRHQKAAKASKAVRKPNSKSTSSSSSSPSHYSASRQKPPRGPPKQRAEDDDRVGDLPLGSPGASASASASAGPRKLKKAAPDARTPNRISYISMSSGSTKLGEIPLRRSRLVWNPDADDFEYGFRPVYPLHVPQPVTEERPGFFRRMFGAREKG